MKKIRTAIIILIPVLLVFYVTNRLSWNTRLLLDTGISFINAINNAFDIMWADIASNPMAISTYKADMTYSLLVALIVLTLILSQMFAPNKYRRGREHGSERWGTQKDIKSMVDKKPSNNIILSQDVAISIDTSLRTRNNNNTCVLGGSGSGKTRSFVKPNLMQMHSSYVVTDPKGEVLRSCGKMLEDEGYKISVLNLVEMSQSNGYNPFEYLRDGRDEDIMTLITTIMQNTDGEKSGGGADPFWAKAEMLFLQALFFYLVKEAPPEEQNLEMIMTLIRAGEIREGEEDFKSPLDILFAELDEQHIARRQYDGYKQAAGKTAKSIIISAYARLAPFNIKAVADLTRTDTLRLGTLGEEKTALFIIISPSNTTFNFIAAMMYSQLFAELDYSANWRHGGWLPITVRFLLDEFANVGKIPNFEKILAYARSLNIGICPILQSLSQLKEMYEKSWETIIDNCETMLFLGGKGVETLKYISELLGKETIDSSTIGKSFARDASHSVTNQILGRELLTPQEVARLSNPQTNECLVFITGSYCLKGKKYNTPKHPNYKLLADSDKSRSYVYNAPAAEEVEVMDIEDLNNPAYEVMAIDLSTLPDLDEDLLDI